MYALWTKEFVFTAVVWHMTRSMRLKKNTNLTLKIKHCIILDSESSNDYVHFTMKKVFLVCPSPPF